MNRKNRAKSSSLFLLELILAILFFSIASAVCVQIFVKSHLLSADAQALNMAVSECSGAAEVISASDGAKEAADTLAELYPKASLDPSGDPLLSVYYDEKLQPCAEKDAQYKMTAAIRQEGTMLTADLEMADLEDGDIIYQLTADHHIRREAGNE